MKKIAIFLAGMVAALGFTGCEDDKDPVYQAPTKFELNTPVLQDQYLGLTPEGTFELVCSQPDYGYSAITNYSAEVSLSEDFANFAEITPTGNGTLARMTFSDAELALALCKLHNIEDEDQFEAVYGSIDYEKVYFRAVAQLKGVESSRIVSNVVSYNKVMPYFAVPTPGFIYLVGAPEGWAGPTEGNAAHYADWRLFEPETAIGSKVYSGVFDIPAGQAIFRFYTALTGWDADSYGSQVDDNPVSVDFTDGMFESALVKGKGSFEFAGWEGGKMTIVVDMSTSNYTVTIMAGEQQVVPARYIYLVGQPEGWKGPEEANEAHYADWRLVDNSESDIYTGTFDIAEGQFTFRFYTALTGWDGGASIGAKEADETTDITVGADGFSGSFVEGKGGWNDPSWPGGKVAITVDFNTHKVQFVPVQ